MIYFPVIKKMMLFKLKLTGKFGDQKDISCSLLGIFGIDVVIVVKGKKTEGENFVFT